MGVTTRVPDRAGVRSSKVRQRGGSVAARPDIVEARAFRLGAAAVASALVTVALGPAIGWTLAPAVLTVIAMTPAAVVDVRERRLPNDLLMIAGVVLLVSLAVSLVAVSIANVSVGGADGGGLDRTDQALGLVCGAVAMTAPIVFLHLASPTAMGFGDVKAALVLGAAVGTVDWRGALIALMLAAGVGAATGLVLRARTIPFGAFLVAGTALALVFSSVWLGPHTIGVLA